MSSRVTVSFVAARETVRVLRDEELFDAERVEFLVVFGVTVARDTTPDVFVRGTTEFVRVAVCVARSATPGVRFCVVVVRPRTFAVVCEFDVFVRDETPDAVSEAFCRPETDTVGCDTRRTAARTTSPISSACAPYNPMNARHPAKISPNFFILCN